MHTRYHTSVVFGFGAAFGGINRDDSWYCYFNASECPSVIGLRTVSGRFCKHIAMRGFLYVQPPAPADANDLLPIMQTPLSRN